MHEITFIINETNINKNIVNLEECINDTFQQAGELGQRAARDTTLFRAGNTFKLAITNTHTGSGHNRVQTVWSTKPWSYWLEYGNNQKGPFIYPVKAKALRFKLNGTWVFRKWVRSHGPLPFMQNAAKVVGAFLPSIWEANKARIFK
jgi:hypothetical protein